MHQGSHSYTVIQNLEAIVYEVYLNNTYIFLNPVIFNALIGFDQSHMHLPKAAELITSSWPPPLTSPFLLSTSLHHICSLTIVYAASVFQPRSCFCFWSSLFGPPGYGFASSSDCIHMSLSLFLWAFWTSQNCLFRRIVRVPRSRPEFGFYKLNSWQPVTPGFVVYLFLNLFIYFHTLLPEMNTSRALTHQDDSRQVSPCTVCPA